VKLRSRQLTLVMMIYQAKAQPMPWKTLTLSILTLAMAENPFLLNLGGDPKLVDKLKTTSGANSQRPS